MRIAKKSLTFCIIQKESVFLLITNKAWDDQSFNHYRNI